MNIAFFLPCLTRRKDAPGHMGAMLANHFAEKGHTVFVHVDGNLSRPPVYPLRAGITLRRHPPKMTPVSETQILLELGVQRPDVIVGLYTNRACYAQVYFAHRLGVPVILSEQAGSVARREWGLSQEEREAVFLGADRIHLLQEDAAETVPGHLRSRVRIMPHPVPAARAPAVPGQSEGVKTLLYAARGMVGTDADILLRTFATVSRLAEDWQCLLAVPGWQAGRLQALAESLDIADRVRFQEDEEDLSACYEAAHLFVFPSVTAYHPMALLEAMAHGLPIVGFADCEGINALIHHGVTGLLAAPGRREATLAEAMSTLMRDAEKRAAMGAAGLKRYESSYRCDMICEKWELLLAETAGITPPASRGLSPQVPGAKTPLERAFARGAAVNLPEFF